MLPLPSLLVLLFAAHGFNAQTVSPSRSSTSSAPASTQTVNVGAAGLVFTPASLTAKVGDMVEFRFYPQNHSVARAEYKNPCIPYEVVDVGRKGFWSDFRPVNVVLSDPPKFSVLINDTEPIFFYCSAPGACQEDLMVGVINPNSTQTLEVQKAFAHNSTVMFSPGENFPKEVADPTKTATLASTSTNHLPSTGTALPSHSHPALSSGAIAGIAIGGVAVLLLGGALIYLCGRQRTLGEIIRGQGHNAHPPPPPSYAPSPGHMSLASYAKSPQIGHDRFSPQGGGFYSAEDASYRSRSPPIDDGMEYSALGGTASPDRAGSPFIRRPAPQTPVTLTDRSMPETLGADGVRRTPSQNGPHELGVENDRNYTPVSSPRLG
ncbi:uncharacterized protein RCO7_06092 [Rhynchosporium graminicola]|uniref:Extracellular serine-rich protein n=1 Tax=Rhynchosporium graminicola TaxID=2792576 RepID=A0A1E1L0R4_9HELO|nr:uncharacterized protein RCO7_06092 [Rhynchosporium commune]